MSVTRTVISIGATAFAVAMLLVPLPASASSLDQSGSDGNTTVDVVPMNVVGYDAAVAAANGFEIVTDEFGVQSSVPVTKAAQKLNQSIGGGATTNGSSRVTGDCGYSTINLQRYNLSQVRIVTRYNVNRAVQSRFWFVSLYGAAGAPLYSFAGGAGDPYWSGVAVVNYGSSGWGNVTPGSNVTLVNGAICWSGSPGAGF